MNDIVAFLRAQGWVRAWATDTEYRSVAGGLQIPHCLCALDLISLERRDVWLEFGLPCPFSMAKDELFVMWAADADVLTFISMNWPAPLNVIDPRLEWMRIDNGGDQFKPHSHEKKGYSLLDAARAFRVKAIPDSAKKQWRELAIRGGPFAEAEKVGLLRYCRADVDVTARVLLAVWSEAGLSDPQTLRQALLRGRFMTAAARCYHTGIPLDMPRVKRLIRYSEAARLSLIHAQVNRFPVYRPDGTFSHRQFAGFLRDHGRLSRWPRTPKGSLSTAEVTFEMMAEGWPMAGEFGPFRTLLDQLRSFDLPIGSDGRV